MTKQLNPDLNEEQKHVLFDKGTETPGTGKYLNHDVDGDYTCANCGNTVFKSDAKFESRTPGLTWWPSFDKAVDGSIDYKTDGSFGMERIETNCANCGAHLGHVFNANDAPSGKHFCINSLSLDFKKK